MTMPSATQYGELISLLRKVKAAFDSAKDDATRLTESRRALRGVMQYLRSDPQVFDSNLIQPLAALSTATYDAGQGATSSLLEHPSTRDGKPTDTAREIVQGTLAYVLEMLIAAKIDSNECISAWIATEARLQGVTTEDSQPIAARQIANWRSEIRRGKAGKAPESARLAFNSLIEATNTDRLRQLRNTRPRQPKEIVEDLKDYARKVIKSIAMVAPRSAPKQIDTSPRQTASRPIKQ